MHPDLRPAARPWLAQPSVLGLTSATSLLAVVPVRAFPRRRDHVVVIVAALFYGSPILYPFDSSVVPTLEPYEGVLAINPLTP